MPYIAQTRPMIIIQPNEAGEGEQEAEAGAGVGGEEQVHRAASGSATPTATTRMPRKPGSQAMAARTSRSTVVRGPARSSTIASTCSLVSMPPTLSGSAGSVGFDADLTGVERVVDLGRAEQKPGMRPVPWPLRP